MYRRVVASASALAITAVMSWGIGRWVRGHRQEPPQWMPATAFIGQQFPEALLSDESDGMEVSRSFGDHPTVVFLFSAQCSSCLSELEVWRKLATAHMDQARFLALALGAQNNYSALARAAARGGLSVIRVRYEVGQPHIAVPAVFALDSNGEVTWAESSADAMEKLGARLETERGRDS